MSVKYLRYLMIDEESKLTIILSLHWGPILVCCVGAIGTYTTQPKVRKLEIFGCFTSTSCENEYSW